MRLTRGRLALVKVGAEASEVGVRVAGVEVEGGLVKVRGSFTPPEQPG